MKRQVSQKLEETVNYVAEMYSKVRDLNVSNETFHPHATEVLSETTAAVVFKKLPTRKLALAYFFYVPSNGGKWLHMFVSYNHLRGLNRLSEMLQIMETYNHKQNNRDTS